MRKVYILLISLFILNSCRQKPAEQKAVAVAKADSSTVSKNDSSNVIYDTVNSHPAWVDSVIVNYIKQSDNEIITAMRKDIIPIEWIFQGTQNTDSAKYLMFQIGHSFEYKYITDSWLYIDSFTRAVYEYDVAKDSLIKWRK